MIGMSLCLSFIAEPVSASPLFDAYEPNVQHPYGRLNPDAPPAVSDYQFMVGDWSCEERRRAGNDWTTQKVTMTARHTLNGYGYWNRTVGPSGISSMLYDYDVSAGAWVIVNANAPEHSHSIWQGHREGVARVARSKQVRDSRTVNLEIVFDETSDDSFHWRLQAMTPEGAFVLRTKVCQRAGG